MKLIRLNRGHRSKLSSIAYIALNIGLALGVLVAVWSLDSVWVALVLTLISKWRVLAVRPRFWVANILANMVDIVVGVAHIILLYSADGSLSVQIGLTLLYIVWLLYIKPRSARSFVALQALVATFYGVSALAFTDFSGSVLLFVVGMWVIGFISARHFIMSYDDSYVTIYSLIWGAVMAELGWLGYQWMFAYSIPTMGIKLVQMALFATVLGFAASRIYDNYHKNDDGIIFGEIAMPVVFSVLLILLILIFFNKVVVGSLI